MVVARIASTGRVCPDMGAVLSSVRELRLGARSVDTGWHRPAELDDVTVPLERRVLLAERHRLGLA